MLRQQQQRRSSRPPVATLRWRRNLNDARSGQSRGFSVREPGSTVMRGYAMTCRRRLMTTMQVSSFASPRSFFLFFILATTEQQQTTGLASTFCRQRAEPHHRVGLDLLNTPTIVHPWQHLPRRRMSVDPQFPPLQLCHRRGVTRARMT